MNIISCLVIDDDELARELLETYAKKISYLRCLGSYENPLDGLSFLQSNEVDLLFLDIQMPDLRGTEFAQLMAKSQTKVVFTTAYSEYALDGFELNALDYLLKPITFSRFLSAVEKFPTKENQMEHIVIKSGYDFHRVSLDDILYVESYGEYVHYYLDDGKKITANQSLSKLLAALPDSYLRVHRSYIVNGKKASGLKGRELVINETHIPISDSYYETVKAKLFS